MMSMGFPFYVFVILLILLPIALVMACYTYLNTLEPHLDEAEGGSNEIEQLETEVKENKEGRSEKFRNALMWNSFILFFYEASLEVSLSLTIGYKYI
jgi:hypothetical protein